MEYLQLVVASKVLNVTASLLCLYMCVCLIRKVSSKLFIKKNSNTVALNIALPIGYFEI